MTTFDRYSMVQARLKERLQEKTSWGRNELLTVVYEVLIAVADDEIETLMQAYIAATEPEPWEV